jgi:hypothetical protein
MLTDVGNVLAYFLFCFIQHSPFVVAWFDLVAAVERLTVEDEDRRPALIVVAFHKGPTSGLLWGTCK